MEIRRMSGRDWKEFKQRWPQARAFMEERTILREYIALSEEVAQPYTAAERRIWCKKRLEDLDQLAEAFESEPYAIRCARLVAQDPPKG